MSIWNKVLVGLIGVATLAFFYMASRALQTHKYWCELAIQFTEKLEAMQKRNQELLAADKLEDGTLGIRRAQAELHRLLINRGRLWDKCEPQKVDSRTGQVTVNTNPENPHRISDKMVLYVFADGESPRQGHYIGEFRVTDVAENNVGLEPTMKMTEAELKRLGGSRGPWTLYELMPVDRHNVFADLSDEEKKAAFPPDIPAEVLAEYAKDGKTAGADDPKDCVVDDKYVRRLRDYKELFRVFHVERTMYVDMYESLTRDETYLKDALADAQQQLQFVEQEVAVLKEDWKSSKKEQKAVADFRSILQQRLTGLQQIVADRIKENVTLAAEIAKIQLDAAQRIDERTRTMAQAGAGNK